VHVARAAIAGTLTALAFSYLILGPWVPGFITDFAQLVLIPFTFPAMVILSFLGVRGGPDGMPAFEAVAFLTFVLSCVFLEAAPAVWGRLKGEMQRQRLETPIDPGSLRPPR
jgi:hypothetical protein